MKIFDIIFVWWIWVALGIIFIILEAAVGNFLLLGVGVSSVTVGIADSLIDLRFTEELALISLFTIIYIYIWKKLVNDRFGDMETGQSSEGIGTIGVVIEPITELQDGKVRFKEHIYSSKEWRATAKDPIDKGTRVRLDKIMGQIAEVSKI